MPDTVALYCTDAVPADVMVQPIEFTHADQGIVFRANEGLFHTDAP